MRAAERTSSEGYVDLGEGERDDAAFHGPILAGLAPEDAAALRFQAVERALDRGVDEELARLMYDNPKAPAEAGE